MVKAWLLLLLLLPLCADTQTTKYHIECYGEDFYMVRNQLLQCNSKVPQACYKKKKSHSDRTKPSKLTESHRFTALQIMGKKAAPLCSFVTDQAGVAAMRTVAMPNPGPRGRQNAMHRAQPRSDHSPVWLRSLIPCSSFSPSPP
ncbi:hypothetical protein AAFF_G00141330 [Aldrovandia affinis]|uniref:Uncharacterized protein n=1 Tax=Aldrovandia affinis TaxID=143900 RepID=A0AAD7X470_9TELE|nr:hypothetical protein AAFF_G00141330 [Aldrovandia affinis]